MKYSVCHKLFVIVILLSLASACSLVPPPPPRVSAPQPETILFIGNGCSVWGHGVPAMLEVMAAKSDPPMTITTGNAAAVGGDLDPTFGPGLARLWEIQNTHDEIQNGHYDMVVLQGDITADPQCNPASFESYARKFYDEITDTGSDVVLFMAWERPNADCIDCAGIAEAHEKLANELAIPVAPVGLAWERVLQESPDIDLFDMDGIHPNASGTYLATNVIYATLFGESPVGHSFRPANLYPDPETIELPAYRQEVEVELELLQMSEEEAEFLQRIAWETVQAYQPQHE